MTFVSSAILLGLFGNFHCMGMCGPIAFILPLNRENTFTKIGGIVVYNLGRILTYAFLGAIFGLFGQGLNIGKFQQVAAISFGVVILLWVFVPIISKKISTPSSKLLRLNNFVKSNLGKRLKKSSPISLFTIGLLNGLLPCGLVYLAIAGSLATGDVLMGSVFMALFGLGTLPVMLVLPYFANSFSAKLKQKAQRILPYALTILAVAVIFRGMNLGIPYLSPKFSDDNAKIESCCHASSSDCEIE